MRRPILILALWLVAAVASADTARRFPHSQITMGEWNTYLKEVKAKPGVQMLKPKDRPQTVAYFVRAERTAYYFTTGGPAHPAVVVARLYERDGKVKLQNFGYFAGSEEGFAQWFGSFAGLGPEIEARLEN